MISTVCDAARRIRDKNPGRVPIICESHPSNSGSGWATKRSKFLVSDQLSIGQFRKFVRGNLICTSEDQSSAPRIQLVLRDGAKELADEMGVLELDQEYVNFDGFLYLIYILKTKSADSNNLVSEPLGEKYSRADKETIQEAVNLEGDKRQDTKGETTNKDSTQVSQESEDLVEASTENTVTSSETEDTKSVGIEMNGPSITDDVARIQTDNELKEPSIADDVTIIQTTPVMMPLATDVFNGMPSLNLEIEKEYPATAEDADHLHRQNFIIPTLKAAGVLDSMILSDSDADDPGTWPALSRSSTGDIRTGLFEEEDDDGLEWVQVDDESFGTVKWSSLEQGRSFVLNKLSKLEFREKAWSFRDMAVQVSKGLMGAQDQIAEAVSYPVLGREKKEIIEEDWDVVEFEENSPSSPLFL